MNQIVQELIDKAISLQEKYKDNPEYKMKYEIIEKILSQNECFYHITPKTALNILVDLEIENPKEYYENILSFDNYKNKGLMF